MIVFDLECANEHVFEAWFTDANAYSEHQKKGLLECPVCGSKDVRKRPSTFAIMRGQRAPQTDGDEQLKAIQHVVKKVQDLVLKNTEDVGTKFAETALKMHYGVVEAKNIRGIATEEQEQVLRDEGIEFFKIPLPKNEEKGH